MWTMGKGGWVLVLGLFLQFDTALGGHAAAAGIEAQGADVVRADDERGHAVFGFRCGGTHHLSALDVERDGGAVGVAGRAVAVGQAGIDDEEVVATGGAASLEVVYSQVSGRLGGNYRLAGHLAASLVIADDFQMAGLLGDTLEDEGRELQTVAVAEVRLLLVGRLGALVGTMAGHFSAVDPERHLGYIAQDDYRVGRLLVPARGHEQVVGHRAVG